MPQNCETDYRGIDNSYSMESRDLISPTLVVPSESINIHNLNNNCDTNMINNQNANSSSSLNLSNETITDNCGLNEESKSTPHEYLSDQVKISFQHQLNHHHPIMEVTRSINHLIPFKKAKITDSSGIMVYPDTTTFNSKTIEDKPPEYMLIDYNRKIVNHHNHHHHHHHVHPMAPVDVNRVNKMSNNSRSPTPGTISSSVYSYMNERQENHSPKSSTMETTINSLKPTLTSLSTMSPHHHHRLNNYRNGYNIKPSISPSSSFDRSRSDNAISSEIQSITINKPTCESITLLDNPHHIQEPINRSSTMSCSSISSFASSSSSCSSTVDKTLPMINVISLNNETITSTEKTITSQSYNKETVPTISNHDEAIMNISDFVNGYSTSNLYSKKNSDSQDVHNHLSADFRRNRYKETWDFLNKSDLIEVTLKTADLMKRNQSLQRDIERLKEEVAKIIPTSKICEDNQMRINNNVCIENSA
ncbi:GATA zinc finger domain-containing protein 11-like isoform X2 [Panonychus citri]|uniref:GATA zinc finger domain-containing protein 11-like isoform X2 n=1 Tax=Panonychus citri TaxID=50023 RepID=UPI002307B72E|nr:GATA zinc finger domain-containing protein 11-like isoform X2 [Panonychus citri]